ncbi:MAG: NAD-dependent epimerase/dehydratase family protein [Candidatus Zixiibacteriota bacterium]|nr:MAG: NAD-dependent epimerase/dehydratase family protein [candidate division Zixibacteria bacterium]
MITGGAGFIGSHVAEQLLGMGHRVVVLDDLSGGFVENVPPGAEFVQGSILDRDLLDRLFGQHRFDYVFHLAAYAAEGLSHFIKHFNYQNNLIGSVNLVNAAVNHDVRRFIFTSSIAVYGVGQLPMTEEMAPQPEDSYGIAKYAVEMELKATHEMFGLDYVIFRPHNVYGERQNIGDKYRNVVGIFMNQILQGKPMTVFGDGEQTRAFSYIGDVAPVIARAAELDAARNQVFNVGADQPYSVNHLARVVAQAMNAPVNMTHLDPRSEVIHAFSDHAKVEKIFDYRPQVSLEEGIRRMTAWVRVHGARQSQEFEQIEIARNLPPSWKLS